MGTILQLLQGYTGGYVGLWELDLSMSPVLWILLAGGAITLLVKLATRRMAFFPRKKGFWLAFGLLMVAIELAVEFTFARGWIYPHLRTLPFLNALHLNPRFGSSFIMPLALLGAVIFAGWTSNWAGRRAWAVFIPLNLLVLVSLTAYQLIPTRTMQRRDFDVSSLMNAYQKIEQGETFQIEKIADITDQRDFDQHASNIHPYDTLFGYQRQKKPLNIQVIRGPVMEIRDGAFNMTNPTSLVYPEANGSPALFSRIPATQQAQMQAFIAHHNPDWNIPILQQIADLLAVVTLLFEMAIFIFLFTRWMKSKQTTKNLRPPHNATSV